MHLILGRPGYRAQVSLSDGSRPTKQLRTVKDAREWIRQQRALDEAGIRNSDGSQRLGEWMQTWFASRGLRVAPRTLENEKSHARRYFGPINNVPLSKLTPGRIEDWLAKIEHDGRRARPGAGQPHTVRLCHSLLSSVLRDAARHRLILTSPMAAVERPKVPPPAPKYLTEEEIQKLMQAVFDSGDPRAIGVMLMIRLGLRRNEVLGLTWQDIDFDNRIVHIRFQLGRITTPEESCLVRRELKTISSRRSLVLSGELLLRLQDLRDGVPNAQPTDFVVTLDSGSPVDPDGVSHWLNRVGSTVGVCVTPHRLRHSAATLMLNAGVPIEAVGKVLGHTDVRTTGVYARVLDRSGSAALEALADVLDQPGRQ